MFLIETETQRGNTLQLFSQGPTVIFELHFLSGLMEPWEIQSYSLAEGNREDVV